MILVLFENLLLWVAQRLCDFFSATKKIFFDLPYSNFKNNKCSTNDIHNEKNIQNDTTTQKDTNMKTYIHKRIHKIIVKNMMT